MSVATLARPEPKTIEAWFNEAERLITGLGERETSWTPTEERNFHQVLDDVTAGLQKKDTPLSHSDVRPSLETVAMFLLERLSMRSPEKASETAEKISANAAVGFFNNQLMLFQITLAENNPKLQRADHAPWPAREVLERKLEVKRPVPAGELGATAHHRANSLMTGYLRQDLKAA